jgi:hypothetical protein
VLAAIFLVVAAKDASAQRMARLRPIGVSTVGPWEVVMWGAARRINYCTLVRVATPISIATYGVMVDNEAMILSVDTGAWQLTPRTTPQLTLALSSGEEQQRTGTVVSARRINVVYAADNDLLDQLQSSTYVDIRVDGQSVRLPFDGFATARQVFDICVQRIGGEVEGGAPR